MGSSLPGQPCCLRFQAARDIWRFCMIASDGHANTCEMSMWSAFVDENGAPAVAGSEGGTIVLDEEHGLGARITLEKDGAIAPFAITCGIYGWMVHTRFFSSLDEATRAYEAMKPELATILDVIPFTSDREVEEKSARVSKAISDFVDRFP